MVMLRGQYERSQMRAMNLLLNTCSGMTNNVWRWYKQTCGQNVVQQATSMNSRSGILNRATYSVVTTEV